ncbi:hypothetical protein HZH66_001412 [Vespula vulgaris]|uniref:Uncharacterized protein n=1 Tax=Vespula vulgaris TaxID=7454 RepID=A0A834KYN1_VESVU|nr:hypothetical protein HZH66_001412 [Vespula vulgaris]
MQIPKISRRTTEETPFGTLLPVEGKKRNEGGKKGESGTIHYQPPPPPPSPPPPPPPLPSSSSSLLPPPATIATATATPTNTKPTTPLLPHLPLPTSLTISDVVRVENIIQRFSGFEQKKKRTQEGGGEGKRGGEERGGVGEVEGAGRGVKGGGGDGGGGGEAAPALNAQLLYREISARKLDNARRRRRGG